MLQKDRRLTLQIDVTATPRHDNGAIFVQTVSDYPLVEAIHQNVVKTREVCTAVAVKVIDIFGNDTMTLLPVSVG